MFAIDAVVGWRFLDVIKAVLLDERRHGYISTGVFSITLTIHIIKSTVQMRVVTNQKPHGAVGNGPAKPNRAHLFVSIHKLQ